MVSSLLSRKNLTLVGILIVSISLPLLLILLSQNQDNRQHAAETDLVTCDALTPPTSNIKAATQSAQQLRDQIKSDTEALRQQITVYRQTLAEKRSALRQQLKDRAQARKQKLVTLMRQDPQSALAFIQQNPPDQNITSMTANCAEKVQSVAGTLNIDHVDYANNQSNNFYTVKTSGRNVSLHFVRPAGVALIPNSQVTAQGYAVGDDMLVPSSSSDSFSTQSIPTGQVAANNISTQTIRVAVVAMNLSDWSEGPDLNTISNTVLSTANSYFQTASFGKTTLTGSVHGWYQSDLSSGECNDVDYANSAMQLAQSQYNFSNVDVLVVVAPFHCGWPSRASIGYWNMSTPNGNKNMGIAMISSVYDPANGYPGFTVGNVEHEIGHTFNIWHAGYAYCNCYNPEYGDPYDVMGNSNNLGILNAAHRASIGWLNSTTMPTVTSTSTFSLVSSDSTGGINALKIPTSQGALFVEYRHSVGLLIHQAKVIKYPYPDGGTGESDTSLIKASSSSPLPVGSSYTDPASNITITFLSNSTTADVKVTVPGTSAATPTPTPKPTETPTPTPKPTATPTPAPIPTNTPVPTPKVPTPTQPAISTLISFNVYLHGIGNGGDNANPASKGNTNPQRTTRTGTVSFYDARNTKVLEKPVNLTYQAAAGNFTGNLELGTSLTNGNYLIKVKVPSYLTKKITGIYQITQGQKASTQAVYLTAGDINNDNTITISDYDVLLGCYSDFAPPVSCTADAKLASDLNDDGQVNQYDYNLLLREWTQEVGD